MNGQFCSPWLSSWRLTDILPVSVVDLRHQTDVCHGNLRGQLLVSQSIYRQNTSGGQIIPITWSWLPHPLRSMSQQSPSAWAPRLTTDTRKTDMSCCATVALRRKDESTRTLKTSCDEMLSPLNLLSPDLLQHGEILKGTTGTFDTQLQ